MDKRSEHKIRNRGIVFGVTFVLFVLVLFIFVKSERSLSRSQIQELITIHPELEEQVDDTSEYYESKHEIHWMIFGGCILLLFAGLIAAMIIIAKMEHKREDSENLHNMQILFDYLERFRRGEFQIAKDMFILDTGSSLSNDWYHIEESLRELGYYYIELNERLQHEEDSTKSFITDISHQLKTPLSSLRMSYELTQEKDLSDEEKREFIQKEKQEIEKLESLLAELVHLSRLESHMIQIHQEMTSIRKTITEAVSQVFLKAHKKKIELAVEIPEDITIMLDPKWTVEALVNVLDNAVKYSKANTGVSVRVSRTPSLVLIEVEDEGMGVLTEELHKIFQRFYRGKDASRIVQEGAGVGLYLARRILEEQGGTITAKRKKQGTIFRMTLPL